MVGTCIFNSNQTSGEFTITVDSSYSDSWIFISSVSNYSKSATITDSTSQTVNVFPDTILYWYGAHNGIAFPTIQNIDAISCDTIYPSNIGTIARVENTNNIRVFANKPAYTPSAIVASVYFTNSIDLTNINTIKVICDNNTNWGMIGFFNTIPNQKTYAESDQHTDIYAGTNTIDVTNLSGNKYINIATFSGSGAANNLIVNLNAIYAE